jgi:hypothetical protein
MSNLDSTNAKGAASTLAEQSHASRSAVPRLWIPIWPVKIEPQTRRGMLSMLSYGYVITRIICGDDVVRVAV